MERKRFTKEEVLKEDYIQMPKWLFNEEFKSLSNDGKVLYSVLRDRHRLSLSNNWVNDKNEIYFLFSRENMVVLLELTGKHSSYLETIMSDNTVRLDQSDQMDVLLPFSYSAHDVSSARHSCCIPKRNIQGAYLPSRSSLLSSYYNRHHLS